MFAPPLSAPPAPPPVLVQGMLGTDLAAWKAAPAHAAAVCTSAAHDPRRLSCILPSQPLGGRYRARELTYGFVDGRLASVRFRSSIDAFPFVTAALKKAYGPPGEIARDKLKLANGYPMDHVSMRWRTAHGEAVLSDPADAGSLEVRLTAASVARPAG